MQISELHFYPVKSCKGTGLEEAVIGKRGILNDRIMMVVDAAGRFMTQREHPRMALITPHLEGDTLTLAAPTREQFRLRCSRDGTGIEVTVWRDRCAAIDQGEGAARWLSEFLATPCRLVRLAEDSVRTVDQAYAPRPEDEVGFADAYPFLLISEGSLSDLNGRLASPLPMNRFRPNIVVRGCEPYAEDRWRRIRIGELLFRVVKPCSRCATTQTDQTTAERGPEPLRTLATYRRAGSEVYFGQNLVHEGVGRIRLADRVAIVE